MRYLCNILALVMLLIPALTSAQTFFSASLTGDQETHEPTGSGSGTAAFVTTDDGLRYIITVEGLTGDIAAAHFHFARAGVDGDVVRTITDFVGNTATGVWTPSDDEPLTNELINALWTGQLYVNVHTSENGGGELRGQIHHASGTALAAHLTSDQEPGGVDSEGSGTASVLLTDDIVMYALTVTGLTGDITDAHFHMGPVGAGGGVVKTITDTFDGPTAIGLWTASDDQALTPELVTALLTGELYLNVHTAINSAGEIRGQVVLNSGWGFTADLDPEQENNNIESDGTGTAALTLTNDGLVFAVTVNGLTGPITNAHFHMAAAGENGGVVRGIADELNGTTAIGVWKESDTQSLTPDLVRALISGNIYLNFHTAANTGGEIRGQVLPKLGTSLSAKLDALQEGGGVSSGPTGTASLWVADEGVAYSLTVDSLSGGISAAHFHRERIGVNGGVVKTITDDFAGNTAHGMWTAADDEPLTDELLAELLTGGLYLNVHTAANPGGEIRGQVLLDAGTALTASLNADQEPGEVSSHASGTAAVTATSQGVVYGLTVDSLSGPINAAHFHNAAIGVNGGVVKTVSDTFDGNTAMGVWRPGDSEALTPGLLTALISGNLYLNVHTAANMGGEIRGQVLLNSGVGSAVELDPQQAGVASSGSGAATVSLNPVGLSYRVTVQGLSGPISLAHFHRAQFGMNGGVVRTITNEFDGPTASGLWTSDDAEPLTNDLLLAVLAGETYINVHTQANQGGEVRGQVRPGGAVITSVEQVSAEAPTTISLRANYPNPFNPSTRLEFTLNRTTSARLAVYNVLGQEVAVLVNERLSPGVYGVEFRADDLPSGLYLARLDAGGVQQVRRMVLLK